MEKEKKLQKLQNFRLYLRDSFVQRLAVGGAVPVLHLTAQCVVSCQCPQPFSARFGEDTVLMYYSVEDDRIAYKVHDSYGNRFSFGSGFATLYDVKANVFVDARTGDVLENRYDQLVSIA